MESELQSLFEKYEVVQTVPLDMVHGVTSNLNDYVKRGTIKGFVIAPNPDLVGQYDIYYPKKE